MEKQKMIDKIYEVIADKTLSFGCSILYEYLDKECEDFICNNDYISTDSLSIMRKYWCYADSLRIWVFRTRYDYVVATKEMFEKYSDIFKDKTYVKIIKEIIWHPVMIWDVLDWIIDSDDTYNIMDSKWSDVCKLRDFKKLPIDDQSKECIEFVYNFLPPK